MGIKQIAPDIASPAGEDQSTIAASRRLPPDAAFWMRRGERLGNALHWTSRTVAALRKGASTSLRQMTGSVSGHPPGEPG